MISRPITIDGRAFPGIHVTKITRNFTVMDGENAGRVLTGRMDRDIIGTFYNYSFQIDSSQSSREEYDDFYNAVSAPVNYHNIVVPYGQSVLAFEAYVAQGQDELQYMEDDANRWGELSINVIAMEPQRRPTY